MDWDYSACEDHSVQATRISFDIGFHNVFYHTKCLFQVKKFWGPLKTLTGMRPCSKIHCASASIDFNQDFPGSLVTVFKDCFTVHSQCSFF